MPATAGRDILASSTEFARRAQRAAPVSRMADAIVDAIEAAPGAARAAVSKQASRAQTALADVVAEASKRAPTAGRRGLTLTKRAIRIGRRALPKGTVAREAADILQAAVAPGPMQQLGERAARVFTGQPIALSRARNIGTKAAKFIAKNRKAIGTTAGLAALTGLYESAQQRQAAEKAREHELLMEALRMRRASEYDVGDGMLYY